MISDNSYERDVYLEERRSLVNAESDSAKQFDKAILTLSSAALGLSIAFIRDIAPTPAKATVIFLYLAWGGFGLALLSTLFSFLLSQTALRRQREILDMDYENRADATVAENCPARVTAFLNWASIVLFVAGVLFLFLFTAKNLAY